MLVLNGTTGVDKVQDGSIYPEDLVQKMTLMTAQTATGTSVNFIGIPSWAKRITVMFNGVSTNGTSIVQVQLGDSGGIENTGYLASSGIITGTVVNSVAYTSGIGTLMNTAANLRYGSICIMNISTNTWVCNGVLNGDGSTNVVTIVGSKTLSATLDRIRITTVNGTDTFDAGTINIMYEG